MTSRLSLMTLPAPELEFGGVGSYTSPRDGLREAGPFDLRFGAAHKNQIRIGFIGTAAGVKLGRDWLERSTTRIENSTNDGVQIPPFDGFKSVFRSDLIFDDRYQIEFESSYKDFFKALKIKNDLERFEQILSIFKDALYVLATKEIGKPDVVICCVPELVVKTCWSVEQKATEEEKKVAKQLERQKTSSQIDLFEAFDTQTVDDGEERLLSRDFRRALKAHAMHLHVPMQIILEKTFEDDTGQTPAEKAWNMSVGLYYKSGGIPWRLKSSGPETCFVGVTFHHFKTSQRHVVRSSIAHAFSTEGEGFALKGKSLPWDKDQKRNLHLTEDQAYALGANILEEYHARTGGYPVRVVLHKTSFYDDFEVSGFKQAFREIPILELINLRDTPFRLLKLGEYPPKRGTIVTVDERDTFLFTTGYMEELQTYPGPHIPRPIKLDGVGEVDLIKAAKDIMGLTRMNWNTSSIVGGLPVTLLFSRRVGGIMDEYGVDENPLSSFRYYM